LLLALLDGCVAVPANGLSVFVAPNFATVQTGQTQQFTSTVTGSSNTAVTWSARGGTISSTGLYTAPSTTGTYTVTATSVADIRRGTFHSGRELEHAVYEWLAKWNEKPKPFTWSATADVILEQGRPSQRIIEDTTLTTLIVNGSTLPFSPSPLPFRHVSTFVPGGQNDSGAAHGSAGVVLLGLYDGSSPPPYFASTAYK
jgi:hypothetical protein